ncbi:MAG: CinA family nicotinamide mononucleotide deamidase-related protein [Flavipsychrobacter sp.]
MSNIKASIITIGDELLIGQTIDTNSAWIAQKLNSIGLELVRKVSVADLKTSIREALDFELTKADIVLLTGGLGPTADDITKPFLSEYFGAKLVVDDGVLKHVKHLFEIRNRPFLERNIKQAEVPDNCTVLHNSMGTAPGMWFEKDGKVIISMPGVPFEMMSIMEEEVIPRFIERYQSDALEHKTIITAGEGESFIAEKIVDIEESLPGYIKLAYLPSAGMVKLRLTGRSNNKETLIQELGTYQEKLVARLDDITLATEDLSLEEIVGKSLLERGETTAFAESCTGGYIAHLITKIPGSSRYFQGGVIPYQIDLKSSVLGVSNDTLDKYGAISEETAIEMAINGKKSCQSNYCLSVTGLLSKSVDAVDELPIGTVWMAVAGERGVVTKRFKFHYDRERNKEIAANMGLLMLWKYINGKI